VGLLFIWLNTAGCSTLWGPGTDEKATGTQWELIGSLQNDRLNEVSGMVVSGIDPRRLWLINDSGDDPVLYSATLEGRDLGMVHIGGARNVDWEDLAGFHDDGQAYLLVADVGDNKGLRTSCVLYVVKEPAWNAERGLNQSKVPLAWSIPFIYEDGPRDCEAVAIDPLSAEVLLVTKRKQPPVIYSLPLHPDPSEQMHVARRRTVIQPLSHQQPKPFSEKNRYREQPTAMDFTPDGSLLALSSYAHIYVFKRRASETWVKAFEKGPHKVQPLPLLRQAEAICFDRSQTRLVVTSEGRPAPLYRLDLRDGSSAP
jgi:hypothetical protein